MAKMVLKKSIQKPIVSNFINTSSKILKSIDILFET